MNRSEIQERLAEFGLTSDAVETVIMRATDRGDSGNVHAPSGDLLFVTFDGSMYNIYT